jgi:hypothetical protein
MDAGEIALPGFFMPCGLMLEASGFERQFFDKQLQFSKE